MEMGGILGQINQSMKVSGKIIKSVALAPTYGQMGANTSDNGPQMTCMESEFMNIKMESATSDNITKTRKKDLAFTNGRTEGNTKDGGLWEISTV
jgi:hypothetical protein